MADISKGATGVGTVADGLGSSMAPLLLTLVEQEHNAAAGADITGETSSFGFLGESKQMKSGAPQCLIHADHLQPPYNECVDRL